MLRKDYWRMSDEELTTIARKYNVFAGKLAYVGSGGPQTVIVSGQDH